MTITLTKANFDAIRQHLIKEPDSLLRTFASGSEKLLAMPIEQRNKHRELLGSYIGSDIPVDSFPTALQYTAFHAGRILKERPKQKRANG